MTRPLRTIRLAVAQSLSVSVRLVASGSQTPMAVLVRHVTMYVARTSLRLTLDEIGRESRRHNSSVLHALVRVKSLIRTGDERALSALRAGEIAAMRWRRLSPRDELAERRERLQERAREMLEQADRITVALGARQQAAAAE